MRLKKHQRGQISVFFVLGIIFLLLLILLFQLRKPEAWGGEEEQGIDLAFEAQRVEQYVTACLQDVAENALLMLGLHGGYFEPWDEFLKTEYYDTMYLYYLGDTRVPKTAEVEKELARAIENSMQECIQQGDFPNIGIMYGEKEATVRFTEGSVFIKLFWPLKISAGNKILTIDTFMSEIPVRLAYLLQITRNIVENTAPHPDFVDVNTLVEQNISIEFIVVDNTDVVYLLADRESKIHGKPYYFLFATKNKVEA